MKLKRREFFKMAGLAGIGLASNNLIQAKGFNKAYQPKSTTLSEAPLALVPLNRFPRMVHEYFISRVRQIEQTATKRRSSLKTKKDAEEYICDIKEKIQKCLGPWPEKTQLNARITKITEREAYSIENLIFESRPGFQVTANLYIPKGKKFPFPAVIIACGHDNSGKISYQLFSGFCQLGYVVLVYDPIGQGERLQYLSGDLKPRHGIGVTEHIYAGNQMFLIGDTISSWFTWDAIRAVDYLYSRPEVDKSHIEMGGVSGGGTQTAWMCGIDPRITMAAPSCWVTTFRRNLENEEPADTEQCPRFALSMGLDHSDFIAAMAPKPVILLPQEKDFFDIRGTEESFTRLQNLYKLMGAEQNIEILAGTGRHSYPKAGEQYRQPLQHYYLNQFHNHSKKCAYQF